MIAQPQVRCVEFVDEITEWMDGALTDEERSLIEEHLSICPHCTRYLGHMRAAIATLRDAHDAHEAHEPGEMPVAMPIAMPNAMRSLLVAALRDHAR